MKASVKSLLLILCFAGSMFGLMGCEPEGPAERAGEKVDETMEEAGDQLEEAGENVQDAAN